MTADPDSNRVKRRFLSRAAVMTMLSIGYWASVKDDEEYQEQEAYSKDLYWIIPNSLIPGYDGPTIRIPKPFEVGLIFSTIPERLMAYNFGYETHHDLLTSLTRGLRSTLEVNYPQAFLPFIEAQMNHSFFTGRNIEPLSYGSIDPGQRYNERTSELAITLGKALNNVTDSEYISPIRIDHLIKGYGGTLGTYMLDVGDWMFRTLADSPERPTRSFYSYPVVRRFLREPGTGREIVTQAYEMMSMVDRTLNTLKKLEDEGRELEAFDYAQSGPFTDKDQRKMLLSIAPQLADIKKQLGELRKEKMNVHRSGRSADHKRRALEIIALQERQAVMGIPSLRRWAFD